MNRHQFSKLAAKKCGMYSDQMENFIGKFTDVMIELLASGETITIQGFGTFKVTEVKEHLGRNIRTGEPIKLPTMKSARFTASKALKNKIKVEYQNQIADLCNTDYIEA